MPEDRTIVLELTKVLHRGQQGNFCIIRGIVRESVKPEAIGTPLVCVGNLPELTMGAYYKLTGKPDFNKNYNQWQLKFHTYEINQTASATGLQNYLAKECPHIAEGRADMIVGAFKEQTMDVLLNHPEKLVQELIGVDLAKAQQIQAWARLEEKLATTKKKLYEAGLTTGVVKKLTDTYGEHAPTILKTTAFDITEIKGIGFLTADRVAMLFGMAATEPQRIKAGVTYALKQVMEDQGHTCVEHIVLVDAACKLLKIHKQHIIDALKLMLAEKELCTQRDDPAEFSLYPELFQKEVTL